VTIGVFVTALYTFRMVFMTFHGEARWGTTDSASHAPGDGHANGHDHGHGHADHHAAPHESPAVVTIPLVLLAVPSVLLGALAVQPMLFGGLFGEAIQVLERNDVVAELAREFPGWFQFATHAIGHPPFWLALAGVVTAWLLFLKSPGLAGAFARALSPLRPLLDNKYYFDWFNENVLAAGGRLLGRALWKGGDQFIIDDGLVNGSAGIVGTLAGMLRRVQSGYLYSYAFWMVIGLALLLGWSLLRA
jgi:NADH-quinone oxidoreductase subunit L